jgi:hypothetical protein
MATVDEFRDALVAEWGVYTAKGKIMIDGVLAFNQGDPVPVSHVTRGVVSRDDVTEVPLPEPGEAVRHVPYGALAQPDPPVTNEE